MKGIITLAATIVVAALLAARADAHPHGTTQMILERFGPAGPTMLCIARRESNLAAGAINWRDRHANGRGSFGLFQIGRIHVGMVGGDWRRLLDAKTNINVAYRLYQRAGLAPWGGGC